jgi:lysophospholipase L1-like esterase
MSEKAWRFVLAVSSVILASCGQSSSVSFQKTSSASSASSSEASKSSLSSSLTVSSSESFSSKETSSELTAQSLVVVGDSTLCDFPNETTYYRRYGYGTQLYRYFNTDKLSITNLAMSGRSSKSFILEANYATMKTALKKGDFLLIGFGHNDEKAEAERYSDPNGDYTVENSFQYNLYNYYVKIAEDIGAFPILCTPICRYSANGNYDGSNGHITSDTTVNGVTYRGGDYSAAIKALGASKNVPVIDLTSETKSLYASLPEDDAKHLFAWSSPTVMYDTTHTSIWGAAYNAYFVAKDIKMTSSLLAGYASETLSAPTRADTLTINPNYVENTFNGTFTPSTLFTGITAPWYGTAFGALGGNPSASNLSTIGSIKENSETSFDITAGVPSAAGVKGGKISTTADGMVAAFQSLDITKDYTFSAKATLTALKADPGQCGFGIMARSDIYIDTKSTLATDYAAAGYVYTSSASFGPFGRVGGKQVTSSNSAPAPSLNAEISLKIVKSNTQEGGIADYACFIGNTEYDFKELDLNSNGCGKVFFLLWAARSVSVSFTDVAIASD